MTRVLDVLRGFDTAMLGTPRTTAISALRRTTPRTADVLTREFRPAAVAARLQNIYDDLVRRA